MRTVGASYGAATLAAHRERCDELYGLHRDPATSEIAHSLARLQRS